jgi:hypothetical protein
MNDEEIDRILANEDQLIPSSGFTASVMDRIREEARVPQPIPLLPIAFPWKRAIPGMVLAGGGLGWGVVEIVRQAITAAHTPQTFAYTIPEAVVQPMQGLGWAALALGVALASWIAARRIAGSSNLF